MDLESEDLTTQQPKANGRRRPVGSSQMRTRCGVLLPSQQTRKLKQWVLTDQQRELVNSTGLGHLALTHGFTIDRSLLTAFCERWNNETNTAHFMGFEMAPSLHDVSYILGIPVTGHVVTAEPVGHKAVKRMCLQYLGESPGHREHQCGLIRLTWLYRKFHLLPENPCTNEIIYSTRAYLLYLVGSTLFPDTMRGYVSPRYLPLLADFSKIREYAWGTAALAHLYRGLSVAVTPNSTIQFLGSATLLMAWIYEYLPTTQPEEKNQSMSLPRACLWNFNGATRGQGKKVVDWRKVFEQLHLSEVNWNPYKDVDPAIVPEYCIAAHNISYSRTWLISFNIKEVYVPDRFSRQFEREQGCLHTVPTWVRRNWSKGKDWRVEYAREIEEFHQLVGCGFTPPEETNTTALPPNEPVAEQIAAGDSLNTSENFATMVEDLKNDLPLIDRYREEQLLPVEILNFLAKVSVMIRHYSPAEGRGRPQEKRGEPSQFQDPSSPQDLTQDRYAGAIVPYQASECDMLFDGTVPLQSGGEGFKEQGEGSQLQTPPSSSSPLESRKRRCQGRSEEARLPSDTGVLRRSGRLCVQLKKFKHGDGVGAEPTDPIILG